MNHYLTSITYISVIFIMIINHFTKVASAAQSRSLAFTKSATRSVSHFGRSNILMKAGQGQCEVVLVGCGAPNRGMGWYHGIQMIEKK